MLKKLLIVLLLAFSLSNIYAQKLEMGEVSIAELTQKAHPIDSSANAAVLFQKGYVSYEPDKQHFFTTTTVVKTRIKIYKKEGYNSANQTISYYSGLGSRINITFSNAYTYNLIGGKIEKTKLKDEGSFQDDVTKFYSIKKITMPNVKVGSVLEFEYTIKETSVGTPTAWYFQKNIPVDYSEFTTQIPEYFTFHTNQTGSIFPHVTTTKVLDRSDYSETKTVYFAEHLPAIKSEPYINDIGNYTCSITHEFSAYNPPVGPSVGFCNNWTNVNRRQ